LDVLEQCLTSLDGNLPLWTHLRALCEVPPMVLGTLHDGPDETAPFNHQALLQKKQSANMWMTIHLDAESGLPTLRYTSILIINDT
jgi:hypothetical protein